MKVLSLNKNTEVQVLNDVCGHKDQSVLKDQNWFTECFYFSKIGKFFT